MEEKHIKTNNILILKSNMRLRPVDADFLRKKILKEIKEGVVIIPVYLEIITVPTNGIDDVKILYKEGPIK